MNKYSKLKNSNSYKNNYAIKNSQKNSASNSQRNYNNVLRTNKNREIPIFNPKKQVMVSNEALSKSYMFLTSNNEIKMFLKNLSEILKDYYWHYCDNDGNITFNNLFTFYKNFSIFPDLINLIQLKCIFSYLADQRNLSQNNYEIFDLDEKNLITFTDFMYSLALTSMLYDFDDGKYTKIDKLFYVVEKMNQSKGIILCQKKCGRTYTQQNDLIGFLLSMKKKYPNLFYGLGDNNFNKKNVNSTNVSMINFNKTKDFSYCENEKNYKYRTDKILNLDDIFSDDNNAGEDNNANSNGNNDESL